VRDDRLLELLELGHRREAQGDHRNRFAAR
jgi:hypothetical protein